MFSLWPAVAACVLLSTVFWWSLRQHAPLRIGYLLMVIFYFLLGGLFIVIAVLGREINGSRLLNIGIVSAEVVLCAIGLAFLHRNRQHGR